jgi:hypothetical protein
MLRQRWVILAVPLLLLLLAVGSVSAAPAITIEPSRGAAGENFVATLAGFTPGESIALRLTAEETSPPRTLDVPGVTIRADGGYRLEISSLLLPPGRYTLAALRQGAAVASAAFTVTGGAAPSPQPGTPTRTAPTATPARPPTALPVTPRPPTAPPTGNGGYLPGMPNTGGGSPPSFPTGAALAGTLAFLVVCLLGGRVLQRAARRRDAAK